MRGSLRGMVRTKAGSGVHAWGGVDMLMTASWLELGKRGPQKNKEVRMAVWGHVIQDPECQAKVVGLLRPTGSIKYCGGSKGLELSWMLGRPQNRGLELTNGMWRASRKYMV